METLLHDVRPHPPGSSELGYFLKQVVVGIEEEGQARSKAVHVKSRLDCRVNVRYAVSQCECNLLHRGASCLAHVVSADTVSCSSLAPLWSK